MNRARTRIERPKTCKKSVQMAALMPLRGVHWRLGVHDLRAILIAAFPYDSSPNTA